MKQRLGQRLGRQRYGIARFGENWFVRDTVTGRAVQDDVLGYVEMTSRLDAERTARRMNAAAARDAQR